MSTLFSTRYRGEYCSNLKSTSWDVLIIGGGITGAGILLDAQVRGMKVALVEMQDFAAGTSSRSTKLVHGGLRYLKQLEFKLVAEVGKERAIVYENGPHVTKAEPMLLPIVKGGSLGKFSTSLGLQVYDWLAGVKEKERRRMLTSEQTLTKEPLLRKEGLVGGAYYFEYRTDDARLTLEIIKEAVERGAAALNYCKVMNFLYKEGKVTGVQVSNQLTGETFEIKARKVVNASGPWVDSVDSLNDPGTADKLHLTKGVHIVLDRQKLPLKQSVYFDTPDKRMVFAIPRDGKVYVGTTDTSYTGDIASPQMTENDKEYLLGAIQYMFPEAVVTKKDIESNWAGLRPLIKQPGKGPTDISRKDEIFQYPSGLISIAGGKLTGYRKMAQRVVDLLATLFQQQENKTFPPCSTDKIPVSGGKVGGAENFKAFVKNKTQEGVKLGLTTEEARSLTLWYGANVEELFSRIRKNNEIALNYQLTPALLAQIEYSIDAEMATSPADFFIRRTGALYFNIHWVYEWQKAVVRYMATYLNWDEEKKNHYEQQVENYLKEANGEN